MPHMDTTTALVSSSSAYRVLWSGPFIKLVNISAEFVSPPKVNICAEFNFNLTSSCLQRLPCLCVCVCARAYAFPHQSILAGRCASGSHACANSPGCRGVGAAPRSWRCSACRGSTVQSRGEGSGSVAEAIKATHRPLWEVTVGKMCPVRL